MDDISQKIQQLESLLDKLSQNDREFAVDLIFAYKKYPKNYSEKRAYWVGKLIERAVEPQKEMSKIDVGDFKAVVALFKTAQQTLKYPKVVLACGDKPIYLALAGSKSKVPGSINVMGEGKYPDRDWYGRISTDGQWSPSLKMTPEFTQALAVLMKEFGADPAHVARKYGKLTGNCCFCASPLTDKHSTAAGFGPVCAKHYGLTYQWKNAVKKAEEKEEQKAAHKELHPDIQAEIAAEEDMLDEEPPAFSMLPVQKGVEVMETMWTGDKMPEKIQVFMPDVVEAVSFVDIGKVGIGTLSGRCFLCDTEKDELVVKNGYTVCLECAHQLEM